MAGDQSHSSIHGADGQFIASELDPGESVVAAAGAIQRAGNLESMRFGGVGLFLATRRGKGQGVAPVAALLTSRRPHRPLRRPVGEG